MNLDPSESKTAPLAVETLEQFGCRLANPTRERIDREQLRQLQNAELEVASEALAMADPGGHRRPDRRNLAGGDRQASRPVHPQAEALSS